MLRKRRILSTIIIVLMVASVGGFFAGQSGQQKLKYNDITFTQLASGQFQAEIEGTVKTFDFYPTYVEKIETDPAAIEYLKGAYQLGLSQQVNSTLAPAIALAQVSLNEEFTKKGIVVQNGFTAANDYNQPILLCANAQEKYPILLIKEGNQTKISTEGYCIVAEAVSQTDVLVIKDRLLYGIYGII